MTPDTFSAGCVAWIDAVSTVLVHLLTKLTIIIALPAYVQLRNRLNRHRDEIDSLKAPAAPAADSTTP
jgi:hypothetical protein